MSDPLDALRIPVVPMAPDPAFAARLRRRIELALTDRSEEPPEEENMTAALARDRLARNGTRHGDVSYITLALPDGPAGRGFYGTVLGWAFEAGPDGAEGNHVGSVIPQIGLWPGVAWRPGVRAGAILGWRVDDISAAAAAVQAQGGTASAPVQQPYGLESECTDGAGLRFWLHQLPGSGEPVGANGGQQGDVSYVVLRVADLSRGEAFFSSVLGWRYEPGRAGVSVVGPSPMTGMSEGEPGVTLCFRVDDLEAAVARVGSVGGRAGPVEARPYGLESLCSDDQGLEFYLHQLSD